MNNLRRSRSLFPFTSQSRSRCNSLFTNHKFSSTSTTAVKAKVGFHLKVIKPCSISSVLQFGSSGPGPGPGLPQFYNSNNSRHYFKMASKSDIAYSVKTTSDNIIWIDLEMTGLDVNKDLIMEIACIVTDDQLNEVARHDSIAINIPDTDLKNMPAWCQHHHKESGLIGKCQESTLTTEDAENKILNFVKKYAPEGTCPMAGNSIAQDRMFIIKYMPKFNSYLHYRNIDVSTIKELVKRWYPKEYDKIPKKKYLHRSLDDIEESIAEARYYRANFFVPADMASKIENKNN